MAYSTDGVLYCECGREIDPNFPEEILTCGQCGTEGCVGCLVYDTETDEWFCPDDCKAEYYLEYERQENG